MKNKLLSKISPQQLIKDFQHFGTATKIAVHYGITKETVYAAFKIINYDCRVRQGVASLVSKELLEEAYSRLGTLKAVARELNITHPTVKYYMKQFGLNFKPQVRYNCNDEFFSRDNEESFYMAGFIAADGCVRVRGKNCYHLYIGLSNEDIKFLGQIKEILGSNAPIRVYENNNKKYNDKWNNTLSCRLDIFSEKMYTDLQRFNIVPRKSLIYTFPEWMKTHPLKHHFIRGYNDGDGSFYCQNERIYFYMVGTKNCMLSIQDVLEKECNVNQNVSVGKNKNLYTLAYGAQQDVRNITQYLYKDASLFLPRKRDIVNKMI